jgi:hypothetical protein
VTVKLPLPQLQTAMLLLVTVLSTRLMVPP